MSTYLTSVRIPFDIYEDIKKSDINVSSLIIHAVNNYDCKLCEKKEHSSNLVKVSVRFPMEFKKYTSDYIRKALCVYFDNPVQKDYSQQIEEITTYINNLLLDIKTKKYIIEG